MKRALYWCVMGFGIGLLFGADILAAFTVAVAPTVIGVVQ